MNQEQFERMVNSLKPVDKVRIRKTDHLQNGNLSNELLNFAGDSPKSQYIERINPGIHLAKVISGLERLENKTDPNNFATLSPSAIADDVVRVCELNREDPMYALRANNLVYGIVSDQHVLIYDKDIYDMFKEFVEKSEMEYHADYYHDTYNMRVAYTFPELEIPLEEENGMNFRVVIGNSQFGVGSGYVEAGSFEQMCTNGVALGYESIFRTRLAHRAISAENFLTKMLEGFNKVFGNAPALLEKLREANEVGERIIKENESVVKVLRSDKFRLLKSEATSVYRRIKANPRYQRMNGFDLGRALAEEARDTSNLTRKMELETLSGRVMVSQVR